MAAAVSKNSTNVRLNASTSQPAPNRTASKKASSVPLALRAARAGFRVIGRCAPSLASSYAERLFLTARRHPRPAWEERALATAERFAIPHDGAFLPAWRWGDGASTVLLVHGWEGRGSQLAAFVEPLLERGFSVVTFDVPGHGDAPSGHASVVEHARAIASVAHHLGTVHAVIAHSVGGAASLFATRLGLSADRLVLVAPPVSPQRFAAGFGEMLGLGDEVQRALVARLERRYGLSMEDLDVRRDAARFTAPLLVVHDTGDRVVPFEDGRTIAQAARNGRLVTTQGLGHHRVLRAPEVLAAVVPFVADGARTTTLAEAIDADLFYRERRW
jgi:pimeloyl-ACP methyl ester carboxylesterase